MPFLKKLFWAYFLLLIFEGALRKWILPQLAAPLLIVRDPIALLIIWEAYRTRKWPKRWSGVIGIMCVGMLGLAAVQLVVGDNSWIAVVYGLRSYLLPFPVAFIMGESLDEQDLRQFATWTLWLLLPLTVLEAFQYSASPTAFVNKGASIGSEQLAYAAGHVRASATFSYVMGPMLYLPMAAAFVFTGMAKPGLVKRWLIWAASCALILSIPVVGSRTVVFELAAILGCVGIAAFFGISEFLKSLQMIFALLVVALLVSRLPIFADASDTLVERFTEAQTSEGGSATTSFYERVVGPYVRSAEDDTLRNPWLGNGVGYGSLAVSKLLTGEAQFSSGEEEFPRVINEFGWPCGLAFMLFRFLLAIGLAAKAFAMARDGQPLAWLLVPIMANTLFLGTLEQPTVQGFMVISVAFTLAALHKAPLPIPSDDDVQAIHRPIRYGLGIR